MLPYRLTILLDNEPWLTPILTHVLCCLQISSNGNNFSFILLISSFHSCSVYSPSLLFTKFPGLILIFSTSFAAVSATCGLKCISATKGIVYPPSLNLLCITPKFYASFVHCVVYLSSSAPASIHLLAWCTERSMSFVSVFAIV